MEQQTHSTPNPRTYEFMNIETNYAHEALYIDCYESLGWQLVSPREFRSDRPERELVQLKFQRDRQIKNRRQLNPLQKKCEEALRRIDQLEKRGELTAVMLAVLTGMLGAFCILGAVFSFIGSHPALGALLTALGLAGCSFPLVVDRAVRRASRAKNAQELEKEHAALQELLAQAYAAWQ